jgi:3,4-dihydroxy 2-butanone 4-phosphate synthase
MENKNLLLEFGETARLRVINSANSLIKGKPIILLDNENRENEGDIIFAAEKITPDAINFLIRNCTGIICLCLTEKRVKELGLNMMVPDSENTCKYHTAFTVSVDAKLDITTGVSASDRAHTIKIAIDDGTRPDDLAKPGHIFPLCAKNGGVLERAGHTEGSIELMSIAGLKQAAVLCELMNPDGTMAKLPEIVAFARGHQLSVVTVEDILSYLNSKI